MSTKLKAWLGSLVPGIITVAVIFGPSKITITSKLGSEYGYSLLWIIVVAIFFMAIFTGMSARIGLSTSQSLLTLIRNRWGNLFAGIIGVGIFLVTTSFQAGNAIGIGIAIGELTNSSSKFWVLVSTPMALTLLFAKQFYGLLSKLMVYIVILMLLSFLVTCFIAKPDFISMLSGFKPSLPDGAEALAVAFIASCFSLVGAFYQSYLVQQQKMSQQDGKVINDRSLLPIILLGVMSGCVMVCASSVLHSKGIRVQSAADMGGALEPLFGSFARKLFLFGLFGASFSSLVGNATLGGTLFADSLGWGKDINDKKVRCCVAVIMVIGGLIAGLWGKAPLQLIVFAQGVTVFVVPVIGVALFLVSNDKKVMKNNISNRYQNVCAVLGLLLIVFLVFVNVIKLFFH